MTSSVVAQARTALSPEWDRGFDEAFTDLVTSDPDLVRDEFDALIGASFDKPPTPPPPATSETPPPPPPPIPPDADDGNPEQGGNRNRDTGTTRQRSTP
jgi:hypothetical protein